MSTSRPCRDLGSKPGPGAIGPGRQRTLAVDEQELDAVAHANRRHDVTHGPERESTDEDATDLVLTLEHGNGDRDHGPLGSPGGVHVRDEERPGPRRFLEEVAEGEVLPDRPGVG